MSDLVTIPTSVWKDTLVKVDALTAENKRFREAFKNIEEAWYKGRSSYVIAIVDDALAAKEGGDAIGCLVNPAKVSQYLPKPNAAKKGSDAK